MFNHFNLMIYYEVVIVKLLKWLELLCTLSHLIMPSLIMHLITPYHTSYASQVLRFCHSVLEIRVLRIYLGFVRMSLNFPLGASHGRRPKFKPLKSFCYFSISILHAHYLVSPTSTNWYHILVFF